MGIVTGGAFGRTFFDVFVRRVGEATKPASVPWFMLGPALAFGLAPLAFTVPAVREYAALGAAAMVDASRYAKVLFGASAATLSAPSLEPIGIGIAIAPLGACAVAWLACTRVPVVRRERRAWGRGRGLAALVRLHDGDSGQYIAWIAGTAAVAATLCAWGL